MVPDPRNTKEKGRPGPHLTDLSMSVAARGYLASLFLVARCVADVHWTTPSANLSGSIPMGNSRQAVNLWVDPAASIHLMLSHVDALDDNGVLSKLGELVVRVQADPPVSFQSVHFHSDNMSVSVDLGRVRLRGWVDLGSPTMRLESTGAAHTMSVELNLWRTNSTPAPADPGTWCSVPTVRPDLMLEPSEHSLGWGHWNDPSLSTIWAEDLTAQGLASEIPVLQNPFANLSFAAVAVLLSGASKGNLSLNSSAPASYTALSVGYDVTYLPKEELAGFSHELLAVASSPIDTGAFNTGWGQFWNTSRVLVRAAPNPLNASLASAAEKVTEMDRLQQALLWCQSGGRVSAAKFNDFGVFSAPAGASPDARAWGAAQWFQNIRLPYYHMLAAGRFEALKSIFEFYARVLPVGEARNRAWFNHSGAFFPETMTQHGTYAAGSYGWGCSGAAPTVPSNRYIRYHREGGLELSLLGLEWAEHTGDWQYFDRMLLPQISSYVAYYSQHFNPSGPLRVYPAQALETWQCGSLPPLKSRCVTNPMPEIAGLRAVLPRLISLNRSAIAGSTKQQWIELLARVPELPLDSTKSVLQAGAELPPTTSNAENPELYAVHPYRLVGLHSRLSLGRSSYAARRFHGATGWSQDVLDAALLGEVPEAAQLVVSRSEWPPSAGYRFQGFQDGIGAGGPITDHPAVTAAGLRYMALQTGLAGRDPRAILLLPSWPCQDWQLDFKLHAPGQTVLQGKYDGNGTVSEMKVTPERRRDDLLFGDCVQTVQWANHDQ